MNRNLHYVTIGVDSSDAAGSVQCLGTTPKISRPLGNSEWVEDLEHVWRVGMAPKRHALEARAKKRRRFAAAVTTDAAGRDCPRVRVMALRSAEWAEHRAEALATSRQDIVDACDQRWRTIRCSCGPIEARVGCEQPLLCVTCRKRHSNRWRKRIVAGMDHALRAARREYWATPRYRRRGRIPGIYLITLTGPHSGSFETDRARMGAAVRELLDHANYQSWWSTYALTWEATTGEDGLGHLHVHMAVISSWIPYTAAEIPEAVSEAWCPARPVDLGRRAGPLRPGHVRRNASARRLLKQNRGLHEVWREAMPGAVVLQVNPPGEARDPALSAGVYLAKYVTKGVDASEFTGRKAGELLVALYCKRKVSTSEGFWVEADNTCACCGESFQLSSTPQSLRDYSPETYLRMRAQRSGWYADGKWRRPGSPEDPPWVRRLDREGRQIVKFD